MDLRRNVVVTVRDYDTEKLIEDFELTAVPRVGEIFTCDDGSFQVRIVEHFAWQGETDDLFDSPQVCLWVSPYRRSA